MAGKRMIIYSGGTLDTWALPIIKEGDTVIGADRGALFLIRHGIKPHLAVGDFDSVTAEERDIIRQASDQFITCDALMKDDTDSELALGWALEQQPEQIIIVGAVGSRLDHTLANIQLLLKCLRAGVSCKIIDANNEVILIDQYAELDKQHYTYCSLLPLSLEVSGVTLTGFQYPLHNRTLKMGSTLGVSNVIIERFASVTIASGLLLIIQSKD